MMPGDESSLQKMPVRVFSRMECPQHDPEMAYLRMVPSAGPQGIIAYTYPIYSIQRPIQSIYILYTIHTYHMLVCSIYIIHTGAAYPSAHGTPRYHGVHQTYHTYPTPPTSPIPTCSMAKQRMAGMVYGVRDAVVPKYYHTTKYIILILHHVIHHVIHHVGNT